MVLRELGLASWQTNGKTPSNKRGSVIAEFAGPLQKPVHVLVTVEVLGEGINIPNADTCMFVEPRNSYRRIIQAIGRVLRHHPAKTLAHIVLPAVAIPNSRSASVSPSSFRHKATEGDQQLNARKVDSLNCQGTELPTSQVQHHLRARNPHTFGTAEDEVASRRKSPAAINLAALPADTRRQADGIHSNDQCETTGTRVWKQACYSNSQAATMINMRCKSVQQRGRIASKNSSKRLVDLLKLGIGTTRCRDLKRKFKLNAWIDSNPGRVIQLRLAGQEYLTFWDVGLMMMRRNCNRPRPR